MKTLVVYRNGKYQPLWDIPSRRDEYIDVRNVWPVYVRGLITITLIGETREVTVEEVNAKFARKNEGKVAIGEEKTEE